MEKWRQAFEKAFGGGPGGPSRANTMRWLMLVAGVGALFMILNSFMTVKEVGPPQTDTLAANGAGTERGASPAGAAAAFGGNVSRESKFAEFEASYENSMKEILQKIVGVGAVDVMITIDATEEIVVERNMTESQQVTDEKDTNGADRHITNTSRSGEIVLYSGSEGETPIVRKTIRPVIRGVLVVAEGAENLTVKKMILEAVERGLNVPANRISIAPSKR